MQGSILDKILASDVKMLAIYAVLALVSIWVVATVIRSIFSRKSPTKPTSSFAKIRIGDLGTQGPPANGPKLVVHGAPVRLALLAIAPAGRAGTLPHNSELGDLLDRAVPGFAQIFRAHQPQVHRWPGQLSVGGFCTSFFRECNLPKEGVGTPWINIGGPIVDGDDRYFVGMLLRTERANNLKQIALDKETQWLEALKASA